MLQRIQSLYLFIVLIAISLMFFFPVANILMPEGKLYDFYIYGIATNGTSTAALSINWTSITIIGLILLNSFVTLFLFKKRMLQIRFSIANIFMMLGSMFLMWYNISNQAKIVDAAVNYKLPIIIPLVTIVLTYLAIRAIGKDEALIRSMDRIR